MSAPPALPLGRQRIVIVGVLLTLAAIAWTVTIAQALAMRSSSSSTGMSGGMAAPAGLTMGLDVVLFLAIWVAMMVAMMFPASAPMVLLFGAIAAGKRQRGQAYVPTWIFVLGYLIVWTLAGVVAYLAATALDFLAARIPLLMDNAGRIGGGLLIVAGIYQLSPLKNICLAKCRTPIQFLMTSWRDGHVGALRMGLQHGFYCLGCCWLLFAILFPLGMMNIAALALLTALISAEKLLPFGRMVGLIAGGVLIVYGILVMIMPALLPGSLM